MDMRFASINLNSVDLSSLEGVSKSYPIPMPVLAVKSSEDVFLVHSLVERASWSRIGSLNTTLKSSRKSHFPIEIPSSLFMDKFMPLGGRFDGTGLYGKIPSPVLSLKVEVPCSYHSGNGIVGVPPNDYVVQTKTGKIKSFSEKDFERLFVSDLSAIQEMVVRVKDPSLNKEMRLGI